MLICDESISCLSEIRIYAQNVGCMVILIDPVIKTQILQIWRKFLELLRDPLRHGLYQDRLCEELLSIAQTLQLSNTLGV